MDKKIKKRLSILGEQKAQSLLISKSYQIESCNYFSAFGEIDIICFYKNTLVFCEVKTRTSLKNDFEIALRAVSRKKQDKMKKTALHFLSNHPEFENYFTRFDVIAVLCNHQTTELKTYHLEEAFA